MIPGMKSEESSAVAPGMSRMVVGRVSTQRRRVSLFVDGRLVARSRRDSVPIGSTIRLDEVDGVVRLFIAPPIDTFGHLRHRLGERQPLKWWARQLASHPVATLRRGRR